MCDRDVKFAIQIGSDWPQMGQFWDFLRSVSVHFSAGRQNVLKLILKSPRFVPFVANLTQFVWQMFYSCVAHTMMSSISSMMFCFSIWNIFLCSTSRTRRATSSPDKFNTSSWACTDRETVDLRIG